MNRLFLRVPAMIGALLITAAALADDAVMKAADGTLTNSAGMTLYTFDKDVAGNGKSVCNGPCATLWPPVAAPAQVAPPYSVVTRDDGARQLAYNGKPLYLYASDLKPGERNGDNFKQVWHIVKQ